MSELWQSPPYVALARRAAAELGANNPEAVRAILALWTCEQAAGGPWPPFHNNPGNLTRHIGNLDGVPHTLATTAPGAGLLYRYSSPAVGADAFAHYLERSTRYTAAVHELRQGHAAEAVADITGAGYGTRASCALGVLRRIHLSPAPPPRHTFRCAVSVARVRDRANLAGRIVGHNGRGATVQGVVVLGGAYRVGGMIRRDWLALSTGHYSAAALYRRIS